MKKSVTVRVSDIPTAIPEDRTWAKQSDSQLSFGALSSARSSTSSNGEYEAILAMLSGPPLKHKPVFSKIPIVLVVLVISALILLAPVLIVWGINTYNMASLSSQRQDEALLRRAEGLYASLDAATAHCEKLMVDTAVWLQGLPRTGNEYKLVLNTTNFGWTLPTRDAMCGGAIGVYLDNGSLFLAMNSNTSARLSLSNCLNCSEKNYNWDPNTYSVSSGGGGGGGGGGHPPGPGGNHSGPARSPENLNTYKTTVKALGSWDQLNNLKPVWGKISPTNGTLFVQMFMGLKRSLSGAIPPVTNDSITGILRFDIKPYILTAQLKSSSGSGIVGTYVVESGGYIIATTMDNTTTQTQGNPMQNMTNQTHVNNTAHNSTQQNSPFGKVILANASEVEIVRNTFAVLPKDLSAGETRMFTVDGYPVAYTLLVTEYGLQTTIVTIGDSDYFNSFSKASNLASGITLAMSIIAGGLLVVALALTVRIGLYSIKKAVNWLIEDQLDSSALVLRGEDGEFDHSALERMKNAKYSMKVYFSEMNEVGQSVEQLAISNRELKAFFPSMFVGMSKDEIKRGAHKTDLRFKNVAVMFVDIVK